MHRYCRHLLPCLCLILRTTGLRVFCSRRFHVFTYSQNEIWFCQIFLTISEVSPNIREKSCQKSVTIRENSRSTLLSFCQICVTITSCCLLSHIFGSFF